MFIQATNLHKTYDKRTIGESVSHDIQENEILAVIGPKGELQTSHL